MSGPGGQIDRRSFFKVIATSGAVAAASGCSRPAGELLSLVTPPEEIIPGVATYFATTCRECPSGCGVLAKNRDGRIIQEPRIGPEQLEWLGYDLGAAGDRPKIAVVHVAARVLVFGKRTELPL